MNEDESSGKLEELLAKMEGVEPSPYFRTRLMARIRSERDHELAATGWPRILRLSLAASFVWVVGALAAVRHFERHPRPNSPTVETLKMFTSPYPKHSIEEAYFQEENR